jgi:hypothetical protein
MSFQDYDSAMRTLFIMLAVLVFPIAVSAAPFSVTIKIEDGTGDAVKDQLVIVQDLNDREHELLRTLSDKQGYVPHLELPAGLYRVIATAPYGIWETTVLEFLVQQKATEVLVRVSPKATHGFGDIIPTNTIKAKLKVIGKAGHPASGIKVMVRDREATLHLERWYKTDSGGLAEIDLVSESTVVVIWGDTLQTTELPMTEKTAVIYLK